MAKLLYIRGAYDDPNCAWIERYYLYDARGRKRELRNIPGNHQYAPDEDEILAWFRSMGVTHVEVDPNWNTGVPPKVYTLRAFARHLRRVAREGME